MGIHNGDKLDLSSKQKEMFEKDELYQLFPEYYVLKVNNFNDIAKDSLDEWIYYLKNSEVLVNSKAKGLKEVAEHLHLQDLSEEDKLDYLRHIDNERLANSSLDTARMEGERNQAISTAKKMKEKGFDNETILDLTGLSLSDIEDL